MLDALLPPREGSHAIGAEVLEGLFITSIIWSLGAGLLEEDRITFDNYIKKLSALPQNPAEGSVVGPGEIPIAHPSIYEYYFDLKQEKWISWNDIVPIYVHDPAVKFSEILVPTLDTVRTTWLLSLMVNIKRPVVLVGETGTSKTATTANFLRRLDKELTVCALFGDSVFGFN